LTDGKESFLIVMEYIGCGSLSIFVKNGGSRLGLDEKQQLYKKFCLDIAEVRLPIMCQLLAFLIICLHAVL